MNELERLMKEHIIASGNVISALIVAEEAKDEQRGAMREINGWLLSIPDEQLGNLEIDDKTLMIIDGEPYLISFDFDNFCFTGIDALTILKFTEETNK